MPKKKFTLTPQMITDYVGVEPKESGNYLTWPCPICKSIGRDKDSDHLRYDKRKRYAVCHFKINGKYQRHEKEIIEQIMNLTNITKENENV